MTDREKVIRGLECCTKDECECCPYENVCFGDDEVELFDTLARDALALLKAQEPIEARLNLCESCAKEYAECEADKADLVYGSGVGNDNIIGCPWYANRWKAQEPVEPTWRRGLAFCGKCGRQFGRGFKYCPDCGRAVKWDG